MTDGKQSIVIYVARYPFIADTGDLPTLRQTEIDACSNADERNRKYYVFKLLQYAIADVYGAGAANRANFYKTACGKWISDVCEFSLSHCGDVVAVAVSDKPVGLDVQAIDPDRFNGQLVRRILTENEYALAGGLDENERRLFANRAWTAKEAAFKRDGGKQFVAGKIEAFTPLCSTFTVTVGNADYYLSVAGTEKPQAKTVYPFFN